MPNSAFLISKEKKYPVKRKTSKTDSWECDPNLLLAAEKCAVTQGRSDIAARAKNILQRLTGNTK